MIATAASVRTGAYADAVRRFDSGIEVVSCACPMFVPLVENGRYRLGDPVVETVAREYLTPLRESGIDVLIMGCTHYPLLSEVIGSVMGSGVTLIDTGAEAARELKETLTRQDALCAPRQGQSQYDVSDRPEDFGALAQQFLSQAVSAVQQIDIERY